MFYAVVFAFAFVEVKTASITLTEQSPWGIDVGREATVTCKARCVSQCNYKVSWTKEDDPTFQWGNASLLFKPATITSRGNYTCIVDENGDQVGNKTLEVLVNYPPQNIAISSNNEERDTYSSSEGANITLACSIDGYPPPLVKWHKDGVNVNTDNLTHKYGFRQHPVEGFTSVYRLTNVRCEEEGTFVCQAGSPTAGGETVESIVELKVVQCMVKLQDKRDQARVHLLHTGETVTANFSVVSNPPSVLVGWIQHREGTDRNLLEDTECGMWHYDKLKGLRHVEYYQLTHFNVTKNRSGLFRVFLSNGLRYHLTINYTLNVVDPGTALPTTWMGYCHGNWCSVIAILIGGCVFLGFLVGVLLIGAVIKSTVCHRQEDPVDLANCLWRRQKTTHRFSMMALDHVHKQLNAVLKGDGGIIGITENEAALRRWMIAGPEMARIIHEVEHENHSWPPSLAENNMMRLGEKSDLPKYLEPLAPRPQTTPTVDVKIFDGAAPVHTLDAKTATTNVKTFKDYAEYVFVPYLKRQLVHAARVDVVWDTYIADSLKAHTREGRGTGEALRVSEKTRLPHFLRVDSNTTELFKFLATVIESEATATGKILITTKGQSVTSSTPLDASDLQP
ncbi:uncharacterized protein LOC124151470 [Haliotis rufescens]|uniref:uncharacterized protein LOC124151470 n=1 Tax=Haliotis rufescens TaxID=6454 RepID=UPI00201E8227|nr:uncharacterized protein LOC124151470 [Haliotis rufescens]